MQADTLGRKIVVSQMAEISGWGAAVAGGIGAQAISLDTYAAYTPKLITYNPVINEDDRFKEMLKWQQAIDRARGWANIDPNANTKGSKD